MSARADAFNDLLPQIASFGEVNRLHLTRFLRDLCICEIGSIPGMPVLETHDVGSVGLCLWHTGRLQLLNEVFLFLNRNVNRITSPSGVAPVGYLPVIPFDE